MTSQEIWKNLWIMKKIQATKQNIDNSHHASRWQHASRCWSCILPMCNDLRLWVCITCLRRSINVRLLFLREQTFECRPWWCYLSDHWWSSDHHIEGSRHPCLSHSGRRYAAVCDDPSASCSLYTVTHRVIYVYKYIYTVFEYHVASIHFIINMRPTTVGLTLMCAHAFHVHLLHTNGRPIYYKVSF